MAWLSTQYISRKKAKKKIFAIFSSLAHLLFRDLKLNLLSSAVLYQHSRLLHNVLVFALRLVWPTTTLLTIVLTALANARSFFRRLFIQAELVENDQVSRTKRTRPMTAILTLSTEGMSTTVTKWRQNWSIHIRVLRLLVTDEVGVKFPAKGKGCLCLSVRCNTQPWFIRGLNVWRESHSGLIDTNRINKNGDNIKWFSSLISIRNRGTSWFQMGIKLIIEKEKLNSWRIGYRIWAVMT